jgi:hypothetical protein
MRTLAILVPLCGLLPATVSSQTPVVKILPDAAPQFVFSGPGRVVQAAFFNPTAATVELPLRARLFQADSATLMPLGPPRDWKTLRLFAGQTALETASFSFPNLRVLTPVEIHWLDTSSRVLGQTTVWVCPPAILKALDRPGPDNEIGIFDPQNRLKPTLASLAVRFQDLEVGAGFDAFTGKLAIVGPFFSDKEMPRGLGPLLVRALKRPLTILCLRPMPAQAVPNAYSTSKQAGVIAVADAQLVANLPNSPQAQINLLRCVSWAEHPGQPSLPELASDGSGP